MKKKYVALMAGVAASMAIAAPTAMAAIPELPALPSLPPIPGAEPNGGDCSITPGSASTSSDGGTEVVQQPVVFPDELNDGNCQSFGNDRQNGLNSGQDLTGLPSSPELPAGNVPQ